MGLSSNLFYDLNTGVETLHSRVSLNEDQLANARAKKDKLLNYLKPELKTSLEVDVKHWLQGSYKNHTLIRPVRKGEEFDIDVGIYIFCNEEEGFQASDIKALNRTVLDWFSSNDKETKLEKSKNSCERLSYTASFHIDIPIYYLDKESGICRLATQHDGWVDSDPKAFQDWFDDAVYHLNSSQLAREALIKSHSRHNCQTS